MTRAEILAQIELTSRQISDQREGWVAGAKWVLAQLDAPDPQPRLPPEAVMGGTPNYALDITRTKMREKSRQAGEVLDDWETGAWDPPPGLTREKMVEAAFAVQTWEEDDAEHSYLRLVSIIYAIIVS